MRTPWRLLLDGAGAPDWNMALDRALLETAAGDRSPPTLRLYWWRPHALSLGANQRGGEEVAWEALELDGYAAVRRPTGGRAILHACELTYSVTAPAPPGGIVAAYLWLGKGLVAGLRAAGLAVDLARVRGSRPGGEERAHALPGGALQTRHPCFSAAGRYEITARGRKLVGSAQCRSRGWLMQHGSILLGPEHLNLPRYLVGVDPESEIEKLRAATIDCSSLLGRPFGPEELLGPLTEGFARTLEIELAPGVLSREERESAQRLRTEQYATRAWTRDGVRGSRGGERSSA